VPGVALGGPWGLQLAPRSVNATAWVLERPGLSLRARARAWAPPGARDAVWARLLWLHFPSGSGCWQKLVPIGTTR